MRRAKREGKDGRRGRSAAGATRGGNENQHGGRTKRSLRTPAAAGHMRGDGKGAGTRQKRGREDEWRRGIGTVGAVSKTVTFGATPPLHHTVIITSTTFSLNLPASLFSSWCCEERL